jgi:hypothetical protein
VTFRANDGGAPALVFMDQASKAEVGASAPHVRWDILARERLWQSLAKRADPGMRSLHHQCDVDQL